MTRPARQQYGRPLLALLLGVVVAGCREDVPLGAWNLQPDSSSAGGSSSVTSASTNGGASTTISSTGTTSGTGGGAGASSDGGELFEMPACNEVGDPGPLNAAGTVFGATETATDWTWPAPVSSMQFDLMVEREVEPPMPRTSGYYWAYQFSFLEGAAGFLGMQAEGAYQRDPDATVDVTKMAVFWLSGPPLDAELGDIAYPDARITPITASGVNYQTIHARFDWQVCHVYRFRIEPHSTEDDGSIWYGAWIEDLDDDVETFLGRMLMPADSGLLSPFSISRTYPIEYTKPGSCDYSAQSSAVYGRPHTVEGDMQPTVGANRFAQPLACPTSRFTNFQGGVRHELGVRP